MTKPSETKLFAMLLQEEFDFRIDLYGAIDAPYFAFLRKQRRFGNANCPYVAAVREIEGRA